MNAVVHITYTLLVGSLLHLDNADVSLNNCNFTTQHETQIAVLETFPLGVYCSLNEVKRLRISHNREARDVDFHENFQNGDIKYGRR